MMNNEGEDAEGMKRGIMVEHRKRRGWDEQFRRDLRGTELLLLLLAPVTARRLDPCLAAEHEKWAGRQSLSSMEKKFDLQARARGTSNFFWGRAKIDVRMRHRHWGSRCTAQRRRPRLWESPATRSKHQVSFMPPVAGAMAENISKPHVKWGGSPPLQIMHEHSTYLPRAPLLDARHQSHQHLEDLAWHARRIFPSPSSPLTFFRETWGWRLEGAVTNLHPGRGISPIPNVPYGLDRYTVVR